MYFTRVTILLIFLTGVQVFSYSVNNQIQILNCSSLECPDGIYGPALNSSTFCKCINGTASLHVCPPGLLFNRSTSDCVSPYPTASNRTDLNNNNNSFNTLTNETINSNDTKPVNASNVCFTPGFSCPEVDGEYSVYTPASNCSQFCECANGRPYLLDCPAGLHFNAELNVCDYPENARCEENGPSQSVNNRTTSVVNNNYNDTENPCGIFAGNCSTADAVDQSIFYTVPSNCSQYCQCLHGRLNLMACPNNLYFSEALDYCDWSDNVDCPGAGLPIEEKEDVYQPWYSLRDFPFNLMSFKK